MTSTPPRSWVRALAVSPVPGAAASVRERERGRGWRRRGRSRTARRSRGRGRPPSQKSRKPGGRDGQGSLQQRDGPPGGADQPRPADPAAQDAKVEHAHGGGGLRGAQSGGGEQFGTEVDQAELDRDTGRDHGGQQPAGQREPGPAVSGPGGRSRGQRPVPVAQVQTGQDDGGQGHRRSPAGRGALEQAEQERGEHRAGGRADVGFGHAPQHPDPPR